METNFTNIKERILHYTDIKGFAKENFFEELGVTYGNFKGKAKEKSLGSDILAKIVSKYPEISPEWLLTGKGDMLKKEVDPDIIYVNEKTQSLLTDIRNLKFKYGCLSDDYNKIKQELAYLKDLNQLLQENKALLEDKVKSLEEKESNRIQELEEEIARLTRENHAIKSQPQNRKTG
ncbi:hypothetical protein [Ornithobacterium rhinotracheale]